MSIRLYELAAQYVQLANLPDDATDEQTDALLAQLEDGIDDKLDSCQALARSLEAEIDALRSEAARLTDRARALERRRMLLRHYMRDVMVATGLERVRLTRWTLSVRTSERIEMVDPDCLPDAFFRIKREVDQAKLAKLYKDTGEVPPGCDVVETKTLYVR